MNFYLTMAVFLIINNRSTGNVSFTKLSEIITTLSNQDFAGLDKFRLLEKKNECFYWKKCYYLMVLHWSWIMSGLTKTYHGQSSVLLFQTSLTYLCASDTVNMYKVSISDMNAVWIFQNSSEINLECITECWDMLNSLDKGRNTKFLWSNITATITDLQLLITATMTFFS